MVAMKNKRCAACGDDRVTVEQQTHSLNVGLDNPVPVLTDHIVCAECGEASVVLKAAKVMAEIARCVANAEPRLSTKEIVFLRKYLDMRQADLGRVLGLAQENMSRCETGKAQLSDSKERLLRAMALAKATGRDDVLAVLMSVHADRVPPEDHRYSVVDRVA